MQIKAILFDIDGTLVDSNDMHVLAWEEAFHSIGAAFDRAVVHDQIGKGTDMLVPSLLPDLDQAAQARLGDLHGSIFKAKFLHTAKPFPRAHDLLVRAHESGQRVVLASSASTAELDHYLDLLNVRDLVDATVSGDDVDNTKPAPDIFATAMTKLLGIGAAEVVVVGDTPYDMEAAAKCRIDAVALRSGKFSDEALWKAGAATIYDDAAALLADYDTSPLGRKHSPSKEGMPMKLKGRFDTRRGAELSIERLVQEYGIDRDDITVTPAGTANSAGVERGGSDEATILSEEPRNDAAREGQLLVLVQLIDDELALKVKSTFAEFASGDVA